jgi:hypothetical protein
MVHCCPDASNVQVCSNPLHLLPNERVADAHRTQIEKTTAEPRAVVRRLELPASTVPKCYTILHGTFHSFRCEIIHYSSRYGPRSVGHSLAVTSYGRFGPFRSNTRVPLIFIGSLCMSASNSALDERILIKCGANNP